MQLTTNFHLSEFACRDGSPVPSQYLDNVRGLACNLQRIRDWYGLPLRITSGYRSPAYNTKIHGAKHSQHLVGRAADIQIGGISPLNLGARIKELIKEAYLWQGGVGIYPTFVHYDIRGHEARWVK